MDRKNANNRSLLALAGQQSLTKNISNQSQMAVSNPSKQYYKKNQLESALVLSSFRPIEGNLSKEFDSKALIKKLGLGRLRKMQALVRGFLVRRKIYPKELEDYLTAQSALDLVISNVIYRECSSLIVQTVTLGRYDQDQSGQQRLIEEYLYNAVIKRVVEKQFEPIAKDAIYQTAYYASRPTITFGFNLRDPLQIILYQKVILQINQNTKEIAEEALREQASDRRELQVIDSMISRMDILQDLYMEIIGESLLQNVKEYVVENMVDKMVKEGAKVIASSVYNAAVAEEEDKFIEDLAVQSQEWFLQQAILDLIIGKGQKQNLMQEQV